MTTQLARNSDVKRRQSPPPRPNVGGQIDRLNAELCPCTCYPSGPVFWAGRYWHDQYSIATFAHWGTVTVAYTDAANGTWESDLVAHSCEGGEDHYIVRMQATGNDAEEVTITVLLDHGGGYADEVVCCEFQWRFFNPHLIDPLCSFQAVRDPDGFEGLDCELGPCRLCVRPVTNAPQSDCLDALKEQVNREKPWPQALKVMPGGHILAWNPAVERWEKKHAEIDPGGSCDSGFTELNVRCREPDDLTPGDVRSLWIASAARSDPPGEVVDNCYGVPTGLPISTGYDPIEFTQSLEFKCCVDPPDCDDPECFGGVVEFTITEIPD